MSESLFIGVWYYVIQFKLNKNKLSPDRPEKQCMIAKVK